MSTRTKGQGVAEYKFGNFIFNSETGELIVKNTRKRLEPSVGRLLAYFLENQHRLITRNELIEHVWKGRVVSDDAINRGISLLRQALNPENKTAFIKTVPRRGYQAEFSADHLPSQPLSQLENTLDNTQGQQRSWRAVGWLSCFLLLAALLWVSLFQHDEANQVATKKVPVIAVLPFSTPPSQSDEGFLGQATSANVIAQLSTIDDVKVIAKTSSFALDTGQLTIADIASVLDADYVLEGSIQLQKDEINVTAQLIDTSNQTAIWSTSLVKQKNQLFAMQQAIASQVLSAVIGEVLHYSHRGYQPEFRAYEQVMLGMHEMEKRTAKHLRKAKNHFLAALQLDENYALAYVYLARSLEYLNQVDTYLHLDKNAENQAFNSRELLQKALLLQPQLSEAHALQGSIYLWEGNLTAAKEHLAQAIRLNPNDAYAHSDIARLHLAQGQTELAVLAAREAIKLNPNSRVQRQLMATILWQSGRAEAAFTELQNDVDGSPQSTVSYRLLSRWAAQMGKPVIAMDYALKNFDIDPENSNNHWYMCLMHIQIWDDAGALSCIADLLESHPDHYEAKQWRAIVQGELDESLQLNQRQAQEKPKNVYFKLQVAEHYAVVDKHWEGAIALMSEVFPELIDDMPQITDRNIWGARILGMSLFEASDKAKGEQILEAVLLHIEKSRRMLSGGYTSGIDDVLALAALGRIEEALDQLEKALAQNWFFYSYWYLNFPGVDALESSPRFQQLKQAHIENMQKQRETIRDKLPVKY